MIPYAEGTRASQESLYMTQFDGAEAQSDLDHCRLSVCRSGSCRGCRNFSPASGKLLDWLSHFNQPAVAYQMLGRFSGVLHLALALCTAAIATGLLHGRNWAWWFAVVLFSVNGCGDLVSFCVTRDAPRSISGVAICSAFSLRAQSPPRGLNRAHRVRSSAAHHLLLRRVAPRG
jgi:hypothetical protein